MPQMAPLNWTMMYMYFIILFLFFSILNFYLFTYKPSFFEKSNKKINNSWKW
uniref:ATP synthase F0 subunit 8 n=1 Tax=Rhynchophorus phoenicis TaxID=206503 RepID=UPI0028FCF674|nr:ATP synthase F0 subunit 8 [Rhynchophorus phoenicis]WNH29320.1 ATP synthase F0 subunit 8 [Rhynchophorus phoenicis]